MPNKIVACLKCRQRNRLPYTFNRSLAKCGRCGSFLFAPDKTEKETLCLLCEDSDGELIFLSNSKAVHKSCVQREYLVDIKFSDEMKNIASYIHKIDADIRKLKPNYGFLGAIFGDRKAECQAQYEIQNLTQKKNKLNSELIRLKGIAGEDKNNKFLNNKDTYIEEIINFWPGYPPLQYWRDIRIKVASISKYKCNDCSRHTKFENGNAHHLTQLKYGGTNEIKNLLWLCISCHEKRHNHKMSKKKDDFRFSNGVEVKQRKPKTIMQKIDLCLSSGKILEIKYENIRLEKSTRKIKILRIETNSSSEKSKLIRAFCYKRKENRTFKVGRIISAKIID